MNPLLESIAKQFCPDQPIADIETLGNGLINDTFLVRAANKNFVLQRLNNQVFPNPERVMENLQQINRHLQRKAEQSSKLIVPAVLTTATGKNYHIDQEHNCWRALQLIEHSESRECISRIGEAEQTGFSLAHFHGLFIDLDPKTLFDTLPGFHMTPQYIQSYYQALKTSVVRSELDEFSYCVSFIAAFQNRADVLEQAKQKGLLHERIIHGDPKLNNFLFAYNSDTIISLIDLDTVKPGLVHYDIGDCLRSCCHDKTNNRFDLNICTALLTSYLQEAKQFFSEADYEYLYPAIELIPFELGLRFFTDFLQGNRYFKVNHPEHNLLRAADQFALCEDISRQRSHIENLIKQLQKR